MDWYGAESTELRSYYQRITKRAVYLQNNSENLRNSSGRAHGRTITADGSIGGQLPTKEQLFVTGPGAFIGNHDVNTA